MSELRYAASHISGDFANPQNAVGNTPSSWAGVLNQNSNYTSRWGIAAHSDVLSGTHTIRCLARKGSNNGSPTMQVNVYVNGSLFSSGPIVNVISTSGQVLTRTFTYEGSGTISVEVVQSGAGGNPNIRNTAQLAYIEVDATLKPPPEPVTTAPVLGQNGDPTETTIPLSWSSVLNADGYKLYQDGVLILDSDILSTVVTGLDPDTPYNFSVLGYNSVGDGPVSNTLNVITLEPPPPEDVYGPGSPVTIAEFGAGEPPPPEDVYGQGSPVTVREFTGSPASPEFPWVGLPLIRPWYGLGDDLYLGTGVAYLATEDDEIVIDGDEPITV